jgi:hypothetical protein
MSYRCSSGQTDASWALSGSSGQLFLQGEKPRCNVAKAVPENRLGDIQRKDSMATLPERREKDFGLVGPWLDLGLTLGASLVNRLYTSGSEL